MTTAILKSSLFKQHDTGLGHPECAARIDAIEEKLQNSVFIQDLKVIDPTLASVNDLALIHPIEYIERVHKLCDSGHHYIDTPDVAICKQSYQVALNAVGGLLSLCDQVITRQIDNGFAMIRPPGHHAEESTALGFCLFNNIAIAARYLQQKHSLERILILDWDVHHGNGTQHLFDSDPDVFYISLHQYPHYPGTGALAEVGLGKGIGATLNCPMAAGAGDSDYHEAFSSIILPAVEHFKPQVVLLSAGFDAHRADPLGSINLTTDSFGWMTDTMLDVAARHCGGHLISVLEGGYNLDALGDSVALHVARLVQ